MAPSSLPTDSTPPAPRGLRRAPGVGLLFALLPLLAVAGCGTGHADSKEQKKLEVIVTTPVLDENVIDYQDFTGRMDAIKTIDIKARVTGYVKEIPFKEGDVVKEGDLICLIDPKSFQADLNLAEANLALAVADADLQEKNAERVRRGPRGFSKEEIDTALATAAKAQASVGAMRAARDKAKVYLDYTRVTAPVTGRISRRYVDPDNDVLADNTMVATVVTEDPIYCYFDVDERTFLNLRLPPMSVRLWWFYPELQPEVRMRLANEEQFARVGHINFFDNRITATSGTVKMRGSFRNPAGDLKAGLFARVRLPISKPYPALVIPDEAVQSDQGKKYVFVVDDENKVQYRPVEIGQTVDGVRPQPAGAESSGGEVVKLRVIKEPPANRKGKEGLSPGDKVIVNGMQRVRAKQEVVVKTQEPPRIKDAAAARPQAEGARDKAGG